MLILLLLACHDLPPDFQDARLIEDFHQAECDGSPYDTAVADPVATADPGASTTAVAVGPVGFRCAQEVQGFWLQASDKVSVLVQPVDMNPSAVAGCDCLYDLDWTLPVAVEVVEIWTRGDNQSGREEPRLEATADAAADSG